MGWTGHRRQTQLCPRPLSQLSVTVCSLGTKRQRRANTPARPGETRAQLTEPASGQGPTNSPLQTRHALATSRLVSGGVFSVLRSQEQSQDGDVQTFLGVLIQARWVKWESTETATTSQFTSWNSLALSLKAMISVGHTKVLEKRGRNSHQRVEKQGFKI